MLGISVIGIHARMLCCCNEWVSVSQHTFNSEGEIYKKCLEGLGFAIHIVDY